MVDLIYSMIYGKSMLLVFAGMLVLIGAWSILSYYSRKHARLWRYLNIVLSVLFVFGILLVTLFSRKKGMYDVYLTPFSSFEKAKTQPEYYRSVFFNVLLFFPIGLTLPFSFGEKRKPILFTLFSGMLLSFLIEILQLLLSLGYCDIDDLLANTAGTFLGCVSFALYRLGVRYGSALKKSAQKLKKIFRIERKKQR